MRSKLSACVATAALALAVQAWAQQPPNTGGVSPNPNAPDSGHDAFASDPTQRVVTVTGTVVSERNGELVLRTDDTQSDNHRHLIRFQVGGGAAGQDVRPGSHVALTYHPTGSTGQAVEQVQVLSQARNARRGGGSDRGGTRK